MIEKPQRIVDEILLQKMRDLPCVVCNRRPPSDPEHWKTVGARADDVEENINPMCRRCHNLKGNMGVKTFWKTFSKVIARNRSNLGLAPLCITK